MQLELRWDNIVEHVADCRNNWFVQLDYNQLTPYEMSKFWNKARKRLISLTPKNEIGNYRLATSRKLKEHPFYKFYPIIVAERLQELFKIIMDFNTVKELRIFADCVALSFLSVGTLFYAETVGAFTYIAEKKPNQPNRDHTSHILSVYVIGHWILDKEIDDKLSVIDKLVELIEESVIAKYVKIICHPYSRQFKPDKTFWKKVLKKAWVLASICHDSAYSCEIEKWLLSTTEMETWITLCKSKNIKNRKIIFKDSIEEIIKRLVPNNAKRKEEKDEFKDYFIQSINAEENKTLDHGQEAAILILLKYTEKIELKKLDDVDKAALLLAATAIYHHVIYTKGKDLSDEKIWKDDPLGAFLGTIDLLAECLRTNWAISEVKKEKNWKVELAIGHIVGINKAIFKWDKNIVVDYHSKIKKYPNKQLIPGLEGWDLNKAVKGVDNDKNEKLRRSIKNITNGKEIKLLVNGNE